MHGIRRAGYEILPAENRASSSEGSSAPNLRIAVDLPVYAEIVLHTILYIAVTA